MPFPNSHSRGSLIEINHGKLEDIYDLGEKMGEGGFGLVRKGIRKDTQLARAVKTMVKPETREAQKMQLFQREVAIMQALDHPHIIRLYETYEDATHYHLAMDLCVGGELFDLIVASGHFTEVQAAHVIEQICKGVNYMHKLNICHRDLKPENFLCLNNEPMEKNFIKIIDFGLSARYKDGDKLRSRAGTPMYAAPEVITGQDYTQLCDLWSIGVIMFILLSGRPPFPGANDFTALSQSAMAKVRFWPPEDWKEVSEDAKVLIKKKLLITERSGRVSAQGALEHRWIMLKAPKATGVLSEGKSVLSHLKEFHTSNKFKRLALEVVANQLDDTHVEKMREVFEALDVNGDGLLSVEEMKEGLAKVNLPVGAFDIISDFDAGESGVIDYSQFLSAAMSEEDYGRNDILKSTFKVFDRDNDGKITRAELLAVLNRRDRGEHGEENAKAVEQMFRDVDGDGDGEIDFEEFKCMMAAHNELAGDGTQSLPLAGDGTESSPA
jgi:calcium-dependent protein kinase